MKSMYLLTIAAALLMATSGCGGDGNGNVEFDPVATPVGGPVSGSSDSMVIGAGGGEITTSDGRLKLTVPPYALTNDTEISIQAISNKAHGGLGKAFRIGPDDTTFAFPATITFMPDQDDLANSDIGGLTVAFQNDQGFWELPGPVVILPDKGTVSVKTTHLSDWSLVQGVVLMPMMTSVKTGESVSLSVYYCYPPITGDDPLAPLGFACTDELAPLAETSDWSVNGVQGGSAASGTISGSGLSATYTAPAAVPSPDTVAVSVRMDFGTILVANITIQEEAGDLNGTVDFTFDYLTAPGITFKATATLALTMHDDGIDETNYDATGSLEMKDPTEFVMQDHTCVLQDAIKPVNDEYFLKILKDPPSVRLGYVESWTYHCTGQSSFDLAVQMYFFTGTGTGCTQFDDVPITDMDTPSGNYTSNCSGAGNCTAEWDFH